MIRTFSFYLLCTFKNMALARLRRLRQPKYLLSALAGLAYIYFFFLRNYFSHGKARARIPQQAISPDLFPLFEVGFAVVLLIIVLLPWFWPGGKGMSFTEAEIQFLFPAPISRRALIRFRLAKGQIGILFGVLISVFIFGRGSLFQHTGFLLATLWLVYSFLFCYHMAASLTKASLFEHGVSGLRRQSWVVGLIALTLVSIAVWLKWFIPAPPSIEKVTPEEIFRWITTVAESGPAFYFLWPFRALLHPAFSADSATFFLRMIPALAVLAATYLWVMSSDARFEEASIERAEKIARTLEATGSRRRGSGIIRAGKARRPPFALATAGAPAVALFWKNLISAGRLRLRIVVVLLSLIVVIGMLVMDRGGGRQVVPTIIGTTAVALACFLTILGPLMIRDDLRNDLLQLDLIKTLPVSGRSVVLGEVLAPGVILTLAEWTLILIAAAALPSLGRTKLLLIHRFAFGLGAAILFPCISLIGLLLQNTAALLLPGWMQLGKAQQRGIEATGQRLITMVATAVLLALAALPAGVAFTLCFFLGYWLIGLAVVPVAALVTACVVLAEAWIGVIWMGRLFDHFDPSLELDTLHP
jgi:ABC-2 type transport system permease protein